MELDNYLLFIMASVVLCIVPGPDMAHLLARTLSQGKRLGFMAALGMNLGGYVHLIAVVVGLSAVLATSATAFTILKWAGAFYLIYIGISAFTNKPSVADGTKLPNALVGARTAFWQGFLSDILNPKVALFFLAFLPQFISPNSSNKIEQLVALGVTVNFIALIINILIVYLSSTVARKLQTSSIFRQWSGKLLGLTFICLGLRLANEKM